MFCLVVLAMKKKKELTVKHRSLYSMTKESQNVFKHGILPNPNNSNRYSITFRCVHWKYLNSTYAVGDSNFGKIKFGEGKGYVGKSTPGLKDFGPLNPRSACNIVMLLSCVALTISKKVMLMSWKRTKPTKESLRRVGS